MDAKLETYYVVKAWMSNNLGIKGVDVPVFAIIHGFTQDGSWYTGGVKYIMSLTSASDSTIRRSLDKLVEMELIKRRQFVMNNVTFNEFQANDYTIVKMTKGSQNDQGGVVKMTKTLSQNDESIPKMTNNIINTIDNNIIYNKEILQISRTEVVELIFGTDRLFYNIAKMFVELYVKNVEEKGGLSAKVSRTKYKAAVTPIRLMMEKDGITQEQFRLIYDFLNSPQGDFWKANILSTKKMRDKANTLILQAKRDTTNGKQATTEQQLSNAEKAIAMFK